MQTGPFEHEACAITTQPSDHISSLNGIEWTACLLIKLPFRHPGQAVGLEMLLAAAQNARSHFEQ